MARDSKAKVLENHPEHLVGGDLGKVVDSVDPDKLAIFGIATDDLTFLKKVVTGYEIMKEVNPDLEADYFLGGAIHNPESLALLHKHGLKVMQLDVGEFHKWCRDETGTEHAEAGVKGKGCWPAEMHWWSVVPEILASRGYGYSMYFDMADVVANKKMPLNLERIQAQFQEFPTHAVAVSTMDWKSPQKAGMLINSGVIWFDNARARDFHLLDKYAAFYQKHENDKTIDSANGKHLMLRLHGQAGDQDFLRAWLRSADLNKTITNFVLDPEWQMICRKANTPLDNYSQEHPPLFVHLANCHEAVKFNSKKPIQGDVPKTAFHTWEKKAHELFGDDLHLVSKR